MKPWTTTATGLAVVYDTWRGVYVFVLGCFVVWVGLLSR